MVTRVSALGEYLRARRGLIAPESAGVAAEPGRRVTGLRRSEVAALAGVSENYYLRLEQGRDQRPSEQVLGALARALQLDRYATEYLFRVAYDEPEADEAVVVPDESVIELLTHWNRNPTYITDGNHDIVASNALARRVGAGAFEVGGNTIVAFFGERGREAAVDWEASAPHMAATLRYHSHPDDPRLQQIVAELTASSPVFAEVWPRHDAWPLAGGTSRYPVEGFGLVELRHQNLAIPGRVGHQLTTIFAEPGTPGVAVLAYLAAQ